MIDSVQEIVKYKDLLYMMTWRDIRIKYKQSIMGFMWAIFMPILIVSAGIMVRMAFAKFSGKPISMDEIASVSVKALPWSLFVSSIRFSVNSLIYNRNLVTKIYFPRVIFPLASVLSQLFDFVIAVIVLVFIFTVGQIGLSIWLVWVPVILALLILYTAGLAILLAAANLFFRDVKYIVEVFLTFAIFFTPVFFSVEIFGKWAPILLLNPVAPILEAFTRIIVYQQNPDFLWLCYSGMSAILMFTFSIFIFRKVEPTFAESI
jgi:lipopolysaccharide transport system permease protein